MMPSFITQTIPRKDAEHAKKNMESRSLRALRLSMPLFLISSSIHAEPFDTHLTLQTALEYGAENNPQVQSVFNHWKSAEEKISVHGALPDPKLTYSYYFESVETRTGPQNQRIGLSQTFPGFGKLSAKKAIASAEAEAIGQKYKRAKLNLNYEITKAYAELYYLKRSTEITEERVQLIADLEQIARTRYKAGSPMGPTLQAQLELGRLEDQLASLSDLEKPKKSALNAALNRLATAPLTWPEHLPYQKIEHTAEELKKKLMNTSPELAELESKIRQSEQQIALARRKRLPDFTLGLQYIETGDASMPVSDTGKDPIIGTVGINLPLWFGKNRAQIQSAAYMKTATQLQLENREQTLDTEIRQVLYELRDADRKISLYKDNLIPKAIQSLEVNRKGFEAGQMEFINLIDAERTLLEFELSRERALADHLIARAKLSKLTGINFLTGNMNRKDAKNTKD